ncbi:response regulator [Sphingomonas sp. AP4-R1]|uniref:response regulator n=1 Tax=Sphingomonas sp. AP4-R1 TaxID=2735134 RepID=UPI001493C92E|nr:response regulator [Sphingomonas sp. AP4-R1]QJU60691.1 response regulator [Sphingomonas sp. AP4-R1]
MTKRILTVDDSPSMRMLLKAALTEQGFQVFQAEDGVDALEKLDAAQPDLIITDINMPRMDGFQLIETLRGEAASRLPILVLTTEASDAKKARAREAGATGWIVKPFDRDKLGAAIRRVLH